jgi:ADYC domain-containing protein
MKLHAYVWVLSMFAVAACSPPDGPVDEEVGVRALDSSSANGLSFNGLSFNGLSFNGLSFNGLSFNGLSFNGATLNGLSFNGLSFNGSELVGVDAGGVERQGAELVGVELQGTFSNGSTLPIRIDAARSAGDVWYYRLSHPTDTGRASPCGVDTSGAPVEAIALEGRWDTRQGVSGGGAWIDDPNTFTFACRNAALAKCVDLGYKPWSSAGGVPLRDHHQACTRMLRADYCGDGRSGTIDGWQVDLYDGVGLQSDTEGGATWVFEGGWGASGATCVNEYRLLELVTSGAVPACALAKLTGSCSAGGFSGGVLLRNKYNSAGLVGIVQNLVATTPDDKLEDALGKLQAGFAALAQSNPDRAAAVGQFEGAVNDLESATTLSAGYADGLMNRVTGVAKFQATSAIGANACNAQNPGELTVANQLLAQGDQARSQGDHKQACAKYKEAIDKAEDALGAPCAAP